MCLLLYFSLVELGRFAQTESCLGEPSASLCCSVVELGGELQEVIAVVLEQLGGEVSIVVSIFLVMIAKVIMMR